ncbi:type II toxin-antitoxin system VapC family toxin [Leucobacter sp. CSA1]|uniref:Type II toxin-antitoxin system VapC family toxin n=1 Tax=Leucobacter chromiisoli TaxID=2796471 RepID=A0A934Q994_9MICO|nr:type II toxin-antitoxin system VapC family toxin [Leucobacter chromiisoli]MBK0419635.1 type II toxin-antitoxin system VapC family toxin [Leucobacter chromiisoli]
MSSVLLDTHVVLWLATSPERVPPNLTASLTKAEHLFVSPVSAFELAQKARFGRLPQAEAVLARWGELLERMIATELPLTGSEMLHAGSLRWEHRDPFDRLIVAQAQLFGLTVATKDEAIRGFGAVSCEAWE